MRVDNKGAHRQASGDYENQLTGTVVQRGRETVFGTPVVGVGRVLSQDDTR